MLPSMGGVMNHSANDRCPHAPLERRVPGVGSSHTSSSRKSSVSSWIRHGLPMCSAFESFIREPPRWTMPYATVLSTVRNHLEFEQVVRGA